MRLPSWVRQHLAALRALLVLTVVCGLAYPLVVLGIAQLPGFRDKADGSMIEVSGDAVGSRIIGQSFTDADGNPLEQYFQSRPSAAGDGYDPTATSASNLGPEDVVDTLPNPADKSDTGTQSLLTQVCARSKAVGELEGVSGSRPFCTPDGVGAVLGVFGDRGSDGKLTSITRVVSLNQPCPAKPFLATYDGVPVECARYGEDHSAGVVTPIRGDSPVKPVVPADAVTASGSGLDPAISPDYARLQAARVAKTRGVSTEQVVSLIKRNTTGRALGFMGEPAVEVLQLNLDLDRSFPFNG